MPQRSGRMLRRAICELESRGGTMPRDLLIEYLWPLAEAGRAYRAREVSLDYGRAKRENGLMSHSHRREHTPMEAAELGQRMIARNRLSGWVKTGILSISANGHGSYVTLERLPWDLQEEEL